jgi:hypothetical protein
VARRGLAVLIARPAARRRPRVRFASVSSVGRPAFAAGATWRCRTTSAPWAARSGHTSVIGAAGAIYVIGGLGGGATRFQDVWASTDGGVWPNGVVGGCWVGTQGYSRGTKW